MIGHSNLGARSTCKRVLHALIALATIACGTKEAPGPLEPSSLPGRIRFVNLITDPTKNPVNAILENIPFGVNLGYTGTTPASLPAPNTANYSAILTGDRTLVLKKTADTSVTVASFTMSITAGDDRTVYAIGGAGGSTVGAFITADVNTPVPTATQTRVAVVNMSPTAGPIDVFITAPNADLSSAVPDVPSLPYKAGPAYLTAIPPGTYQFRAVPAGTAPANRAANVIITLNDVGLAGGTGRTIVAADNSTGGSPLRAFVLTDR